jgi:glyoxalase family protein
VSFAVPAGSLDDWRARFEAAHVTFGEIETRFGEIVLPFQDPHGLRLALVEVQEERLFVAWKDSPVPPERQLRGMHAVRLWERNAKPTEMLLTQVMGFEPLGIEDGWHRYGAEARPGQTGISGKIVEVREMPAERRGQWGTGGVHHVAWRVKDTDEEMALRSMIEAVGLSPTPQIDRFWFKSVYFREPGGTLFELATDGPGFDLDEDREHLSKRP